MFTVTLITNPAMYLDPALVTNLRNAMGGSDAVWLDPNHVAEFQVERLPSSLSSIWESLQAEGVDLVAQPSDGRKKKMLLADMDSTMIQQECIDELAEAAGAGEQVRAVTKRAMNGEIGFEESVVERVKTMAGLPEATIGQVLENRITLMPGGPTLVATMKANGGYAALVSGGFVTFTTHISAKLGFDEHRANRLVIEDGQLTGDVERPILGRDSKVDALEEITGRLGITPADVVAIGDGANDLGMLEHAGTGVAIHAKPAVQAAAQHKINHGDLTAILFLQGYSRDEFITP